MARADSALRSALGASARLVALGLTAAGLATLDSWPLRLRLHLLFYFLGGLAWLAGVLLTRGATYRPRYLAVVVVGALALRAWAVTTEPGHSDDVYRYLWDARVQQHGYNPYLAPPEDQRLAGLRNEAWARVNNRHLPTIYPPLAQLAFRVAARPAAPLLGWKLLVLGAELATAGILAWASGPWAGLAWLTCPLVVFELDLDGHVDALAIFLLCAALAALHRARARLSGALLGLAMATKLLPVFLVVALRGWRARLVALVVIVAVALPFAGAGRQILGSLGEYGRRWRSNDGAFSLLYGGSLALVRLAGKRAPTDETRLGGATRLVTGRDRDEAYPDELAGALARGLCLALFVAAIVFARRHADRRGYGPAPAGCLIAEAGIGAFLLLTPSLHPWYALWILPPVLLGSPAASVAGLWLVATAALGHVPLVDYLAGRPWHDPLAPRLVEHAPAWALAFITLRRLSSWKNVG
jgi:alpha-1,6-mannosyltransferase